MLSSPRIDPRLLEAIRALDDPCAPVAEIWRRVGRVAEELGLPGPSYERVRQLVIRQRELSARRGSRTDALLELAFYTAPPQRALSALVDPESADLA